MSQHAARILRNLQRHIEHNGSTDAGTIAVLKQVIEMLSQRSKPIPKKRVKARRGPMRDPKYLTWLKWEMCAVRWPEPLGRNDEPRDCSAGKRDPAHTQNNGMRSKGPDSSCVPLCRKHHQEYDAGRAAFENKYGVNMKALAAEHYSRFQAESGTNA